MSADAPVPPRLGEPPPDKSPYELALSLHAEGAKREDIATTLKTQGLDEESVKVVMGSLPGAPSPSTLPEAHFDMATNTLAPKFFALGDLGIEGDRRVVGLYWLTFGLLFAVLTTGALLLGQTNLFEGSSSPWGEFATRALPWVGYPLSLVALGRGALLALRRT